MTRRRIAALALALALHAGSAASAEPGPGKVLEHRATIAGELTITQLGESWAEGPFRIALDDRAVLETDNDQPAEGMPIPSILTSFRGGLTPYDEIVVMQQNTAGNACNGGPIWFLGLTNGGGFTVSEPIDFCGGADPVIERKDAGIVLTFPGGTPNRGVGELPTEVWVFENGASRQLK